MRILTPEAFLSAALADEEGYFVTFKSREEAQQFRNSCYQMRGRQRRRNSIIYGDEPGYVPFTEWDGLKLTVIESKQGFDLVARKVDLFLETTQHGALSGQPKGVDNPNGVDNA